MSALQLRELRLTAFKSYSGAVLPLRPLTLLIGRNGSGKSNALDALEVLSRLARGEDVRDAFEGGRSEGLPIRGGLEGCAPSGADSFSLGVTVGDAEAYEDAAAWSTLDVTVQVRPEPKIVAETFEAWLPSKGWRTVLATTEAVDPLSSDIPATVLSGRRGPDPQRLFRSSRLLTSQLPLRLDGVDETERDVLDAAEEMLATTAGLFHLDPVPHLMRSYVPRQDATLRRTADNLSAAVARLKDEQPGAFAQLVEVARQLPEQPIDDLVTAEGGFGDVMLALREGAGANPLTIPARQMSDGMLRVLAVATALLSGGGGLAIGSTLSTRTVSPLCLVLEEIENGLHPSQASRLLDLVKTTSSAASFQVVATTHSPALLNALAGDDHRGVVLCERDADRGTSELRPLTELPGYLRMMAITTLGDAVATDRIVEAAAPPSTSFDLAAALGGP